MRSRLLLNIVLLAMVVALTMIVYNSTDQNADKIATLTTLSPDAVSEIRIRHNQREIVLLKQAHGWNMTRPIEISANAFRVNTLLRLLTAASHADYDTAGLDLASYGLDRPATSVRFNDVEIAFGISNPVSGLRYVRIGERMHLIDDSIYPLISSQIGSLVALELLPRDADIVRLALPGVNLTRNDDASWSSDTPLTTDVIRQTLDSWKHVQAFGVHNYLQRKSLASIEVILAGTAEPLRFEVTDTDPWLIIARPALDIEYHFNIESYDALLRPGAGGELPDDIPAQLRDELEGADHADEAEPGA